MKPGHVPTNSSAWVGRSNLSGRWLRQAVGALMLAWFGAGIAQGELTQLSVVTARARAQEIAELRIFADPLEAAGEPTDAENRDLAAALQSFRNRTIRDDFSPLTEYLARQTGSAWEASLLTQLGTEYYRTGHFSRALAAWEEVWQQATERPGKVPPLAIQRAASELANLYARLGRMDQLRSLLKQLEGSRFFGNFEQTISAARDGLQQMQTRPEIAFRCGPLALDRIRSYGNPTNACHPLIFNARSTTNGICLNDVAKLSEDLGMNYQMAFRSARAPRIIPSVVHWRVGHYAALVREKNGLILAQDPTFWNDTWLSPETLDEEASGYFLVPPGPLPKGWRNVSPQEASAVWGKGTTGQSDQRAMGDYNPTLNQCQSSLATPVWDFNLMLINQRITDTPIGYRPAVGPPVFFKVILNAQDSSKRSLSGWGTALGLGWTCNWNSFLMDDPLNPSSQLNIYLGGGLLTFNEDPNQEGIFRCQFHNPGYVQRVSTNGLTFGYIWNLPDGAKRSFALANAVPGGSVSSVLLSAITDPAGNSVTLEYDSDTNYPGRLVGIVDALGQRTRLEYGLTDPGYPTNAPFTVGNSQFHYQVTKVTDPFGRSALFDYKLTQGSAQIIFNSSWLTVPAYFYYCTNITDMAGMSSQLEYDPAFATENFPFVSALTTPYGRTQFKGFVLGGRDFGFEITDAEGQTERLEYSENGLVKVPGSELQQNVPTGMTHAENAWLYARNVYHWSKKAYAEGFASNDYSKATIYHFTHAENLTACGPIIESIKRPLENRVWFNYPGQGAGWFPGTDDHPTRIGRVLDDGTTQLWQFGYNDLGNVTNSIDPSGRTFSYLYDSNGVDLLEIRQTRNGKNELLSKATYNTQHLPLTITEADGQTTSYSYNGRGQLVTLVDAKQGTNTFGYDSNGNLIVIDGPLPGPQDRFAFTYDAVGRPRTVTDSDSYTITMDYDNLDRLTKMTFPDGTYQEITFDRLYPGTFRDRLGRVTTYTYTALRQLASVQDPLGRLTRFQWCGCGQLDSLIDPLGRMTRWQRDIEGRVTAKLYADGSTTHYDYEQTTSRVHDIRDEQNQVSQFDYFPDNGLRKISYVTTNKPTPSVEFTYDPDYPRVAGMQDGEGSTSYSYYPITVPPSLGAGQIATINGPWVNSSISYGYDEIGRLVSRAINGIAEKREFDAGGRLVRVTNAVGSFNIIWENGSGRISTIQYPNGQHTQYAYDPALNDQTLHQITHFNPDNSVLSQFTYRYDVEGNITNWGQLQSGTMKAWQLNYDDADRLTGVTVSQEGANVQSFAYAYDGADNRIEERIAPVKREFYYNALNQLTGISNSAVTGVSYEWDAAHRLAAINQGAHRTEFGYDGYGRRTHVVEKDNNAVTSDLHYLWCDLQRCEERDASGGVVLKRFLGNAQQVVEGANVPAGNYFFTSDHLGSVREVVDSTGLRAAYAYEPFGLQSTLAGNFSSDLGFAGLVAHSASGLNFAALRNYDPHLGRWLNRDPVAENAGVNLFAYVQNSPISNIDPYGLDGFGISFYAGIGGGLNVKWNMATGNFSVTPEIGFGEGADVKYSPDAMPATPEKIYADKTDYSQVSINGDIGASAGPFGAKASLSTKSCDDGSFKQPELSGEAGAGPIGFSTKDGPQFKIKWTKLEMLKALGLSGGASASAKANVKVDFIRYDPTPLLTPSAVHPDHASSGPAYIKTGANGQYVPLNQFHGQ